MVFRTNKGAPNFRLIVIDLKNPDEKNWETLIEVNKIEIELLLFTETNEIEITILGKPKRCVR